jgi:putative iron-only hydrogenase system regulator
MPRRVKIGFEVRKMKNSLSLIGITVAERAERAPEVQEIITSYGSDIIGRLGIPSPDKEKGLITLVLNGQKTVAEQFFHELQTVDGLEVQLMSFSD